MKRLPSNHTLKCVYRFAVLRWKKKQWTCNHRASEIILFIHTWYVIWSKSMVCSDICRVGGAMRQCSARLCKKPIPGIYMSNHLRDLQQNYYRYILLDFTLNTTETRPSPIVPSSRRLTGNSLLKRDRTQLLSRLISSLPDYRVTYSGKPAMVTTIRSSVSRKHRINAAGCLIHV